MTTEELVRLIEQDTARHLWCPDDFQMRTHYPAACIVTIGSLSSLSGAPRRSIEEAIQQARLEGVPIITDGGVRVAQTAAEAHQLARWLRARVQSQMDTIAAITSQARLMEAAEKSRPIDAVELWERLVDAA